MASGRGEGRQAEEGGCKPREEGRDTPKTRRWEAAPSSAITAATGVAWPLRVAHVAQALLGRERSVF